MKKLLYISVALCLVVVGCSKEEPVEEINDMPLALFPQLRQINTKAMLDNTTIEGESIRIQVSKEDGSAYNADAISVLDFSNPNWVLSKSLYLTPDFAQIYAYAPCADPATEEDGSFNTLKRWLDIPAIQDMSAQTDYLYSYQQYTTTSGTTKINSANPSVQLTLDHALTQVAFVFYKTDFSGDGDIYSVKIKDLSAPSFIISKSSGNDLALKVADGTITGGETIDEIGVINVGSSIALNAQPSLIANELVPHINAYLLFAPISIASKNNIQFTFNIDGRDYVASLTGTDAVDWEKGMQYIYTVKLAGTELVIESVSVTPWNPKYEDEVVIN